MDQLWSPWRSVHVSAPNDDRSQADRSRLFKEIAANPEHDDENLVVWRGRHVFVVMNLYPYNNGHVMILPLRRVATFRELSADEQAEIASTIARCMKWIDGALQPDGYNVGMNQGAAGGAGFPDHLHVHVVPRWTGDTNFMATIADVKVIPEALRETYHKLVEAAREDG